jgi:prolyl oligopeptidase
MPTVMEPPPYSPVDAVTEVLHGVTVIDPYRWLEDQDSPQTRDWLKAQTEYARAYLESIPGRDQIRERIRELLDVETYDSIQQVGARYFFRKRLRGQEQPCVFMREGPDGEDCLLIDPAQRGTGNHTAVKPLRVSTDGRLLLYEVKEGGERSGTFELLDIERGTTLSDVLPRGYLRGFAFAPDSRSFYYVHEAIAAEQSGRTVYHHVLGTPCGDDKEIFFAGHTDRLSIVPGKDQLGFLVRRFSDKQYTDFHVWRFGCEVAPKLVIRNARYKFAPLLMNDGRILAVTDRDAPNYRIVRLRLQEGHEPEFVDVIPAADVPIQNLAVTESRIFVSYIREIKTQIVIFDLFGKPLGRLPIDKWDTVRLSGNSVEEDEVFFERESFTQFLQIHRCSSRTGESKLWAERIVLFNSQAFSHRQVWFTARDHTRIPMFLVGRRDVLEGGRHPAIMTSYGGYGVPMTPQFSVFVAYLLERGCLFALPNIRGGSEFGVEWHEARQAAKTSSRIR